MKTMKRYMEFLMIWTMVLIGAALFMSKDANAIIVGTVPAGTIGTPFIGPVLPSGVAPFGLAPRPAIGFTPGIVRPPFFNPFLVRPVFNPFLVRPIFNPFFNPFVDADDLGIGLGLGVNPGFVDFD
jgi:hypothetical protein